MALPGLEFFGGLGLGSSKTKRKIFGSKPVIPEYPTLEKTLGGAIDTNIKLLPKATDLSEALSAANLNAFLKTMETLLPGYGSRSKQIMDVLGTQLRGDLGVDLPAEVNRSVANAMSLGIGGREPGTMGSYLTARDIGLRGYQVQQNAMNQFNQLTATQGQLAPRPITPGAFLADPAMAERQAQNAFQRNVAAAGIAAAPDPTTRGLVDMQMATIGMILSIYGGGAGYQNTYRQPQYDPGGGGGGGGGPSTSGYNYSFQPQFGYVTPGSGVSGGGSASPQTFQGGGDQMKGATKMMSFF